MDWFERLTGFREGPYADTRSRLRVAEGRLYSDANGGSWAVGDLSLPSLAELRAEVLTGEGPAGRIRVRNLSGDIRALHMLDVHGGALFQVASQFNMLEMVGPNVTPEAGVTGYEHDLTQGPACAIAAGAATIFRNYFAAVDGQIGQTSDRQLDGSAALRLGLSALTGHPEDGLWTMRNGYALPSADRLADIGDMLGVLDDREIDQLRGALRVGLHRDVEVTDAGLTGQIVSQIFCSAMAVAYTPHGKAAWAPLARLVLEAAYEATVWAGVLNARRGASDRVFLTRLGGGAFGNDALWIDAAMQRALDLAAGYGLDVGLVSHGAPPASMLALADRYG